MFLKCAGTGSSGNGYALIADNGEILLIECGVPWKQILRMIDFRPSKVVGCVASHAHLDHLRAYKEVMNNGIPIYTNDETVEHFEIVTGEKMIGVPDKIPFKIGSFEIVPFYVPHDGTPNFAYIITFPDSGKMLYATDFEYLPFTFKSMKLNYMLIECNHMDDAPERDSMKYEHSLRGHSSLNTVKKIVEVNKTPALRNVVLCHLSADWSDPETMKREIKEIAGRRVEVNVAKPGMSLGLRRFPF